MCSAFNFSEIDLVDIRKFPFFFKISYYLYFCENLCLNNCVFICTSVTQYGSFPLPVFYVYFVVMRFSAPQIRLRRPLRALQIFIIVLYCSFHFVVVFR